MGKHFFMSTKVLRNRGMAGDVGGTLITLLVIGVLAYVSIKIFSDMSTNLTAGFTGNALAASSNFKDLAGNY
jgi:hypothetical protein